MYDAGGRDATSDTRRCSTTDGPYSWDDPAARDAATDAFQADSAAATSDGERRGAAYTVEDGEEEDEEEGGRAAAEGAVRAACG